MPDLVICDTSPLFYLHRLRHLSLLQNLYHRILVPEAVVAARVMPHEMHVTFSESWGVAISEC